MASHTYSKEAHSRAVVKFVKNKLDRIEMRCTKESGLKQEIVEHTKMTGESINAFMLRAVKETMERDIRNRTYRT